MKALTKRAFDAFKVPQERSCGTLKRPCRNSFGEELFDCKLSGVTTKGQKEIKMKTAYSIQMAAGLITVSLLAAPSTTRAEGVLSVNDPDTLTSRGIYGANRRVITQSGYVGVQGSFTLPTIFVPLRINGIQQGAFDFVNYAQSTPSFYLGCSQQYTNDDIEVDAGLRYDWRAIEFQSRDESGNVVNTIAPPGWGVFVFTNSSSIRNGQRSSVPRGWRIGATTNSSATKVELRWVVEPRSALIGGGCQGYLEVKATDSNESTADITTPGPEAIGDPNRLYGSGRIYAGDASSTDSQRICTTMANMRVKRIVCITQGGDQLRFGADAAGEAHYEEDGSYMIGCTFAGVSLASDPNSTPNPNAGQVGRRVGSTLQWQNWSTAPIDQGTPSDNEGTGYYPRGRDVNPYVDTVPYNYPYMLSYDTIISKPYFEFPKPPNSWADDPSWASDPNPTNSKRADPDAVVPARYDQETVNIWLRTYRNHLGVIVTPAESASGTFTGDE